MELGYEKACDSVHRLEYTDNWTRTFKKIPEIEQHEIDMLSDFIYEGEITRAIIYLTGPEFGIGTDMDTAEFMVREILRGNFE